MTDSHPTELLIGIRHEKGQVHISRAWRHGTQGESWIGQGLVLACKLLHLPYLESQNDQCSGG